MKTAIIALTRNGVGLSEKISSALEGCKCYAFEKYSCERTESFSSLSGLISDIFCCYDALIFICACGTAVRVIAPHIRSKLTDPAVIVIDEQGHFAVSLLSGHIGGANAIAEKIAEIIGAVPVITTATDTGKKFSPDSFAAANGLFINEIDIAKKAAACIVDGGKIGFFSEYECRNIPDIFSEKSSIGICISSDISKQPFEDTLHLIPKNIVIGAGCKRNISPELFIDYLSRKLEENSLSPKRIKAICSVDLKKDEPAFAAAGKHFNVPVRFYSSRELMKVTGNFSSSEFVMKTVGTDNVCERSAVIDGGRLIISKQAEKGMTFAAAEHMIDIDFERKII